MVLVEMSDALSAKFQVANAWPLRGRKAAQRRFQNAFNDADVYYAPTLWPQYFPVFGGTSLATPNTVTHPNVDVLSQITEDQIVSLIERM